MGAWPQLLWLGWWAFGLIVAIRSDGEMPKTPNNAMNLVVSFVVSFLVLKAGGFWAVWGIGP